MDPCERVRARRSAGRDVVAMKHTRPVFTFPLCERRYLRLLDEADAEELYEVVVANREYLAGWMPRAAGQTLEGTVEFIRTSRKQFAGNDGFQAGILEDGHIVGVIGYHHLDWENRSTRLGYWISERSQGRGIVTSAVRALVDHAFAGWKLNRVTIHCAVANARIQAIPARLGFQREGVFRQAERLGDRYVDHAVYAILASDRKGE